jgi:hypothetical protein
MRGNDGVRAAVPATCDGGGSYLSANQPAFWGQRIALAARYLTA